MSESLGLGKLITTEQHRDAIHIAVAPVTAAKTLYPGQRIGFIDDKNDRVSPSQAGPGIVDPFLELPVFPDQKCWMYLTPGSINSLRHEWTHPAFASKAPVAVIPDTSEESIRRLIQVAQEAGLSYEELMAAANDYLENNSYLVEGGRWEGFYIPDTFWDDFEKVTGKRIGDNERGNFFSCSC